MGHKNNEVSADTVTHNNRTEDSMSCLLSGRMLFINTVMNGTLLTARGNLRGVQAEPLRCLTRWYSTHFVDKLITPS